MTIGTDPEKISAMKDFPLPKSLKALRSFLGMVGWYRKFINNFASVAAPLTDLLKQKKKFVMTPEGKEYFEALKDMLCSAPVLRSPDFWWSLATSNKVLTLKLSIEMVGLTFSRCFIACK